jgi:hypothetical protein
MVQVKNDRFDCLRAGQSSQFFDDLSADAIPDYDDVFADETVQRRFAALIAQSAKRADQKS